MRCFIAIELDERIIRRLQNIQSILKKTNADIKLVEPENLHITVKFLGEISEKQVSIVKEIMNKIAKEFTEFEISVENLGAFPNINHPRAIWAGVREGADKIISIHKRFEGELVPLGFRKENKEFKPHITLCRVKGFAGKDKLKTRVKGLIDTEFGYMKVKSIALKESKLMPTGPKYTTLYEVKLLNEV